MRTVLLDVSRSTVRGSQAVRGVSRYFLRAGPLRFRLAEVARGGLVEGLARGGDAAVVLWPDTSVIEALAGVDRPVVILNDEELGWRPWVRPDNHAVGRAAAEHLLSLGHRRLAFAGTGASWSRQRFAGFEQGAAGWEGAALVAATTDCGGAWWTWRSMTARRLAAWLRRLAPPLGVLACNDVLAERLLDAAERAGLAVPEDVAVVGVDNDPLICELARVPMTSVVIDMERAGALAAEALDRMLAGEPAPAEPVLVPAGGVVARRSTGPASLGDPIIEQALRQIHDEACDGLRVESVCEALRVSRSWLEKRFRELLQTTPAAEVRRVRLDRARQLLRSTDLSLAEVAHASGYSHASYLHKVLMRAEGSSPSAFRQRHLGG